MSHYNFKSLFLSVRGSDSGGARSWGTEAWGNWVGCPGRKAWSYPEGLLSLGGFDGVR